VLAGLASFSQTVGSLLRTPLADKATGKIMQKVIQQIHFNGKMYLTTFNDTTTILITLNWGDSACTDITYNIYKCNITCMFLSTVIRKSFISKISHR
jgi:hypothetical protein